MLQPGPAAAAAEGDVGDMQVELAKALSSGTTAEEKEVLRYYYYINNGIDTQHVGEIEGVWIENIANRIAESLRQGKDASLGRLADEVAEDYQVCFMLVFVSRMSLTNSSVSRIPTSKRSRFLGANC